MFCDILAGKRWPPCKKMCQIPDHKVFYVSFMCLSIRTRRPNSPRIRNGTNSQGPIPVHFCCFPVTSEFILCTIISSLASMDSPPDLFPFADLFCRCLFWNCLWNLKYWSARSMMVVAALGEIHSHLLIKFRLKFIFISLSAAFPWR